MTANAFPERRAAFPETVPPPRCGVKQGVSATGKITAPAPSLGAGEGCGNLSPADTNGVLTFNLLGTLASKTVIFALSSDLITHGIGQYNICWMSTHPFIPLGGGTPVNVGLLPNCKNSDIGPCVLFRTSGQHNVGFFGILAPPGDPQAYPGV